MMIKFLFVYSYLNLNLALNFEVKPRKTKSGCILKHVV